jgi:hypothetical protein
MVVNYNIQYQIMNSISIYVVLTRKNSLNTSFVFLYLLYSPVGFTRTRLLYQSAIMFGLHFPRYLLSVLRNILVEAIAMFSGKKIQMGM